MASAIVPNVYQDAFGEGSFIGKGIYDLKVFDQVLSNAVSYTHLGKYY